MRYNRSYFFGPDGPGYSKFSVRNIPTKVMYQRLFGSQLFVAEVSDTAKTTEAGHVKLVSDSDAMAKSDGGDSHSRVLLPHQIPGVGTSDHTEATTLVTAEKTGITVTGYSLSLGGGLSRLLYEVSANVENSVVINGNEAIALSGDETTPTDGKFYGKLNGVKGWYDPISDPNAVPYTGVDSVDVDNSAKEITLVNDTATPTANSFYGYVGGVRGWFVPSSSVKILIGSDYTPVTQTVLNWQNIANLTFLPATYIPTAGCKLIIDWWVKRGDITGGTSGERYFDFRIGALSMGAQLVCRDQYVSGEDSEETYHMHAEITNQGSNNYYIISSMECISAMPTEKESKQIDSYSISLPATTYISLWVYDRWNLSMSHINAAAYAYII